MKCEAYISNEQPKVKYGLWMKPVSNGFAIYMIEGGSARTLQVVDDNETETTIDDVVESVKGKADKVKGGTSGNLVTLNNKGNITDAQVSVAELAPMGTADDPSTAMTLYGLKAYVDSKV